MSLGEGRSGQIGQCEQKPRSEKHALCPHMGGRICSAYRMLVEEGTVKRMKWQVEPRAGGGLIQQHHDAAARAQTWV